MTAIHTSPSTWQTIKASKPAQALCYIAERVKAVINAVLDFVLPRNPVTGKRQFRFIPLWVENAMGKSLYNGACPVSQICKDPHLSNRVQKIFDRLVAQCDRKDLKYEIRVMQDDKTVNAFCAPGGKVVITTALLKKLDGNLPNADAECMGVTYDDKIAAVLGHEISHAAIAHGVISLQLGLLLAIVGKVISIVLPRILIKRKEGESSASHELKVQGTQVALDLGWQLGSLLFTRKHSRCQELEADRYGIKYAKKAGYNPNGALWIQHLFLEMGNTKDTESFLDTHPSSDKRLDANRKTLAEIQQKGLWAFV